jgi:hypothetical protein
VCEAREGGKFRLATSQLQGMVAGNKFRAHLPACMHTVTLTWPAEVKAYFTFALPKGCAQCRRAAEAAGGS